MKSRNYFWTLFILILLPVCLTLTSLHTLWAGQTLVKITNGDTGRRISCNVLKEGEILILTWTNSLFRLLVTETYKAKDGILEQTSVIFADPSGREPPLVKPEDVDDFYHTGGPFKAEGLTRPFRRIAFRVGEVGNPVLKIQEREIAFVKEVGFGGTIILECPLHSKNENACHSNATNSSRITQ